MSVPTQSDEVSAAVARGDTPEPDMAREERAACPALVADGCYSYGYGYSYSYSYGYVRRVSSGSGDRATASSDNSPEATRLLRRPHTP
ncbi:hypothetical protein [Streptomyces sp. NBC_00483]|uniref:hypothetical protein n=1 Tax=Streptomyces sp. NBC_00483 TaxID=2975756 RepID=UPI002E1892D5